VPFKSAATAPTKSTTAPFPPRRPVFGSAAVVGQPRSDGRVATWGRVCFAPADCRKSCGCDFLACRTEANGAVVVPPTSRAYRLVLLVSHTSFASPAYLFFSTVSYPELGLWTTVRPPVPDLPCLTGVAPACSTFSSSLPSFLFFFSEPRSPSHLDWLPPERCISHSTRLHQIAWFRMPLTTRISRSNRHQLPFRLHLRAQGRVL